VRKRSVSDGIDGECPVDGQAGSYRFIRRISTDKRASVYEYRVHSRVLANRKLLLAGTGTNCRPFVEVRLVATVMKSIALVHSGLISVLPEPKRATQEARFSSYCRLLPPRPIAKLNPEAPGRTAM
jgi:hypothetical protein